MGTRGKHGVTRVKVRERNRGVDKGGRWSSDKDRAQQGLKVRGLAMRGREGCGRHGGGHGLPHR